MRLTAKSYYGIKALLDLAMQGSGAACSVRAIALRQQIPAAFLEKVLIDLRQAGLVRSRRGVQGGYRLARPPRRIRLAEILAALGEKPQPPELVEDWVVLALWQRLAQQVQQVLEETTLEDLYFDARSWQAAQGGETEFIV